VTDHAALVEANRFLGRELLLWLWFESEHNETKLRASTGKTCSLWVETQITLAADEEEARIKSGMPAATPEAKQALRQGKLPRQARLHAIVDDHEFTWAFKADELGVGALKVPAELKADTDRHEALYERMRLVEELEGVLEDLFADFITLRLSPAWAASVVPLLQSWAYGERVDEAAYGAIKAKLGKKRAARA
jgi:hypothetical protein